MIKLLREFLTTGIEANKKSIEASESAIKSFDQSFRCGIANMQDYEVKVINSKLNVDARIVRLQAKKRKTLEDKAQLGIDLKMQEHYERNS